MSTQQPVYEHKATYYKTSDKKWITGTFILNGNTLQFHADEDKQEPNLRLPLSTISGLEKRQSSFIYAAVVVSVGAEKHWFASFPNRDTVYNLLELFWRESLLSVPNRRTPSVAKEASSSLGKDLLSILHESEVSLIDAANALSSQGRQIEESQLLMQDINEDLSSAEKFLKSMSVTQTLIGLQAPELKSEEEKVVNEEQEEHRQKTFKVTFSVKGSEINDYERGTLIIADTISVLDEHKNKRVQVHKNEVEKILITSPWAFSLEYSSEWVTKTCHFICPQVSGLLKFINCVSTLKNKISYENEDLSKKPTNCTSNTYNVGTSKPASIGSLLPVGNQNSSAQTQVSSDVISDEDMEQISNVLNNLQALATEVSREQQDQMEKINLLINDVDKTGLRINENNKNIKKNT